MSKTKDEIYCPECGKLIKRNAVICVHCGVQVKEIKTSFKQETITTKKDKTTAVVLAAFFGYWSWLYTYKKDFKKFWIFFSFMWVGAAGIGILINSSLESVNVGTWIWLYFLISISSYIWALTNAVRRPTSFYLNYPYESL